MPNAPNRSIRIFVASTDIITGFDRCSEVEDESDDCSDRRDDIHGLLSTLGEETSSAVVVIKHEAVRCKAACEASSCSRRLCYSIVHDAPVLPCKIFCTPSH